MGRRTGISEELETPDELDDIEDSEEAGVAEIPVVAIFGALGTEGEVLEYEEGDQAGSEQEEERDVDEGARGVMEESAGIVQEDALKSELVGVEPEHAENDDCQHEAYNSDDNLPGAVVVEVAELCQKYLEETTRVSTPTAMRVRMAKTWAMWGAKRGTMCTMASQMRPRPSEVRITAQNVFWKP